MNVKFVTCSGANEHTSIDALFALFDQFPCIEFGIQVSGEKCGENSARLIWLRNLRKQILERHINLPLALHLNKDWVEAFCFGELPHELQELMSYGNYNGEPLFKRVQLNFKIGRDKTPNVKLLEEQMMKFPHVRFILSYNKANAALIHEIYCRHNVVFDCLFDESHGEGIVPLKHHALVFPDVLHGYAGGLSPENVVRELDEIAAILPPEAQIFIDAEGKLKGEDGHFSYSKAHDFVANALQW